MDKELKGFLNLFKRLSEKNKKPNKVQLNTPSKIEQKVQFIELEVVNSSTILTRVIQIINRRLINIKKLSIEENEENLENGSMSLVVEADDEQARLLKLQFEKVIDVINVSITNN